MRSGASVRARNLKPSLFKNELLAVADPLYTVIFEGLWCLADREGRLEDRPAKIHFDINPGRSFDTTERSLTWLHENGFILRYQVGGVRYIQVLTFKEHQNPHQKEPPSKIPAPEASTGLAPDLPGSDTIQASVEHGSGRASSSESPFPLPESPSPEVSGAPPARADKQPKPEGEMAIALRDLGVVVRSIDPVLIGWVKDGFTTQQAIDAVGIARIRKPHPEAIPANYLDKILRQPARPPPASVPLADRITWRPPDDDGPNGCTPPNSTPSSKH